MLVLFFKNCWLSGEHCIEEFWLYTAILKMRLCHCVLQILFVNVVFGYPTEGLDVNPNTDAVIQIMGFDSLNSDQLDKSIGHNQFIDIPESSEAVELIQSLNPEVTSVGGKLDLGSSKDLESEMFRSVSKDATVISGLYKFEPHAPGFFKDINQSKSSDIMNEPSSASTIAQGSEHSTETTTSIETVVTTPPSPSSEELPSTSNIIETPKETLSTHSTKTEAVVTTTLFPSETPIATSTSQTVEEANIPNVDSPGQNAVVIQPSDDKEKVNIERTIKETIERLWKETAPKQAPELPDSPKKEETIPSPTTENVVTHTLTSITPPISSIPSLLVSSKEEPIVTTTILVTKSQISPEPQPTETIPAKPADSNEGSTPLPSPNSELRKLLDEYLGNDAGSLNVEKLRKMLDVLLKAQSNSDSSAVDITSGSRDKKGMGEALQELIPLSKLEDFESLNPEILETLGLKETIDESKNTEPGSFIKKLKKIPQNVFDLVDQRYGDEYREENGEVKNKVQHKPGKVKTKASKNNKKSTSKSKKNNSDAAASKKHGSLNEILKEIKRKEKASTSIGSPDVDEEYKNLNEGKVVFGFDKKQRIGLRKSRFGSNEDEGLNGDEKKENSEIEYYEPEKFLFDKSSINNDNSDSPRNPNPNVNQFSHPDEVLNESEKAETFENQISKVTNEKNQPTSSNHNSKATNGTKPMFDKIMKSFEHEDSDSGDKKSLKKETSLHNDPYSIPKLPIDQLKQAESLSKGGDLGNSSGATKTKDPSGDKTINSDPKDKFKKNPALIFLNDESDSSFDFTKSEGIKSIKLMSWSIMGAAILIATSVVLV